MMHRTKKVRSSLVPAVALLVGLASLGLAPRAQASTDFPPLLKAALDKQVAGSKHCIPACTACHNTTKGGPGDPNVFGKVLETKYGLVQHSDSTVDKAIANLYAAMPADDADGDMVSDIAEIAKGDSPSISGIAGEGQFCPDIEYGCGAHIAVAPPTDRLSLFPAGLVVLGLAAMRRVRNRKRADLSAR